MYNSLNIAERIKIQAKQKGIVIKDMLSELELGSNTMSNMRHGRMIAADSLAKIADYLDCSVDYLLGKTNTKEKPTPKGELGEDMVVVHRNGERIVYHITDDNLQSILPLLENLEAKSDPDL